MFPLGAVVQCLHIEGSRNLTERDRREEESQLYLKSPPLKRIKPQDPGANVRKLAPSNGKEILSVQPKPTLLGRGQSEIKRQPDKMDVEMEYRE